MKKVRNMVEVVFEVGLSNLNDLFLSLHILMHISVCNNITEVILVESFLLKIV